MVSQKIGSTVNRSDISSSTKGGKNTYQFDTNPFEDREEKDDYEEAREAEEHKRRLMRCPGQQSHLCPDLKGLKRMS